MGLQIFDSYKLFFITNYNTPNKWTYKSLINPYRRNISNNYQQYSAENKKQSLFSAEYNI